MTAAAVDKVPGPLFSTLSNTFQSLLLDLEGVREVRDNETPKGLRKFAIFLICVTPIMLAPYWSHFCSTASGGEISQLYTINEDGAVVPLAAGDGGEGTATKHPFGCIAGYFISVLYVIITFSLLRVQEALEDPFDGMGKLSVQPQPPIPSCESLELAPIFQKRELLLTVRLLRCNGTPTGEDDIQWQNFARHLEQVEAYGADGVEKRKQTPKFEPLYQGDAGKGD